MGTERVALPTDVWAAIPVFNNKDTVVAVAMGCRDELPHVLVVDDGSTDADVTGLFKGTDVVVLRHDRNLGKGRAIRTALRYVRDHGGRFMITLDADGQHHPRDIRKFLPVLEESPTAIVLGARPMNAPNVPGVSRFGMHFSDFWLRLETGVTMRDTQSGFRAYPVAYVSQLKLAGDCYDFEAEVLAKAAWAGLTVKSVDIDVTYAPKGERVSHFRPFLDNLRLTRQHTLLVCRRLLPWSHRRLVPVEGVTLTQWLRHPVRVLRMLLLEHATPAELGMAAAVGTFVGASPLFSLHTVIIVYVATRLRLNRMMAVAAQNICMPPLVPFVCVELGYFMRHGGWLREMTSETWIHQAPQRLWEWLLGSLIVAPVIAAATGCLVFAVAALIRNRALSGGKTNYGLGKTLALLVLVLSACVAWGSDGPEASTNVPPVAVGLPLWEAGMFGVVGRLPHYRGSDEYTWYVLPLPYAIYRGEVLKADREGVRGLFHQGPRIEMDLSMNGNPPVNGDDNARRGMSELEPLIEMGPAVKVHLCRGEGHPRLFVEATARAVISVDRSDLGSRYEGNRAALGLVLTESRFKPWLMGMRAGVDFADAEYNSYFYDVSEAEVLPGRVAYRSEGGYGGCGLSGFLVRDVTPDVSISLYGRWDNIDGAVYEDSPMVKRRSNAVIGMAMVWRIAVSRERVRRR